MQLIVVVLYGLVLAATVLRGAQIPVAPPFGKLPGGVSSIRLVLHCRMLHRVLSILYNTVTRYSLPSPVVADRTSGISGVLICTFGTG